MIDESYALPSDAELINWVERREYVVLPRQSYGWLVTASPDNPVCSARGAGPTWRAAVSAALWGENNPQMGRVEGLI